MDSRVANKTGTHRNTSLIGQSRPLRCRLARSMRYPQAPPAFSVAASDVVTATSIRPSPSLQERSPAPLLCVLSPPPHRCGRICYGPYRGDRCLSLSCSSCGGSADQHLSSTAQPPSLLQAIRKTNEKNMPAVSPHRRPHEKRYASTVFCSHVDQ